MKSDNILELAINLEQQVREFYQYAAENSSDDNIKSFFESMVTRKDRFESFLSRYKGRTEKLIIAETDEGYELPIDEDDDVKFNPGMSLADGVALAMKEEKKLQITYDKLMSLERELDGKDLLKDLSNACSRRIATLENIYNMIAFNEVW